MRLGACVFGAWSGGAARWPCSAARRTSGRTTSAATPTSLAFRVNRGEIVLNDANSGTVWDVDAENPTRIDNWEAFTSKKKDTEDENENENQTDADKRPPQAKPDAYGVRAGRTTVLHPLDNDSAPEGRLLSIVDVDQPNGGARVEISPDGQTLVLQMPEKARPAAFDYVHRRRPQRAVGQRHDQTSTSAPTRTTSRRSSARDTASPPTACRTTARSPCPVLADWRDDRDGDTLILDSAQAVGGEESGRPPGRPPTVGSASTHPRSPPTAPSSYASSSPSPTAARARSRSR